MKKEEENKKVALVLSGGGAEGAYEIGVWKALRKLKINFKIATGTSVGALNAIMVVQDDFTKAYDIWSNISFADIYKEKINPNISLNELFKKYAKEIVQNGGMDPAMLEHLLSLVYDEKKFYASDIDYGLVTYNLTLLKPEIKTKKDIKKGELVNYAIASATCFPAFKVKNINDTKYIDGGYYDNLPINLAIDMGATEVIAVDLKAIGFKRKTKKFNGKITIISPNNKLLNMLDFNAKKARVAICLGYNDTMKKYGKLDGEKYTFKKDNLKENYEQFLKKKAKKKIHELDLNNKELNKLVENCGKTFNLPYEKIYDIKKFNDILKTKLEITRTLDLKDIIQNKRIKSIFDKSIIVKTIYKVICGNKEDTTLKIVKNILNREYEIALYLKIML